MLFNSPCHIACSPFLDTEHWTREFNDKLYKSGRVFAAWTHLQVPKVAVLSRWPRLQSKETFGNEATANTQHDARPLRLRRARSRPERQRAKSVLAALYPAGNPDQETSLTGGSTKLSVIGASRTANLISRRTRS